MVVDDDVKQGGKSASGNKTDSYVKVNVEDAAIEGTSIRFDADADAYDRGLIMPAGIYKAIPYLDNEGFKMDKSTNHFFCGLEWKILECVSFPDKTAEYKDQIVTGGASTTIYKGKKTSTMATIMSKNKVPVGKLVDTKQTAMVFKKYLAKEIPNYILIDWRSWDKDREETLFWSMEEFPRNPDGTHMTEGMYNGRRFMAQLSVKRVIGPDLQSVDMDSIVSKKPSANNISNVVNSTPVPIQATNAKPVAAEPPKATPKQGQFDLNDFTL